MTLSSLRILPEVALLPEIRDLMSEYPFLAHRDPETVRRALRMLRGVEAPESEVATVLEALTVEGEVLA